MTTLILMLVYGLHSIATMWKMLRTTEPLRMLFPDHVPKNNHGYDLQYGSQHSPLVGWKDDQSSSQEGMKESSPFFSYYLILFPART